MLIIGDFAYAYIKSTKIELMEIVCTEKQFEKVKMDYGLLDMIRINRHMTQGYKNGIHYRIIFSDHSKGLQNLVEEFNGDGDEYVVANEQALFCIYKEKSFYRTKKVSDWVQTFDRYYNLKTNYFSKTIQSRRGHLNMLALGQRDWICSLPDNIIEEFKYIDQKEYLIEDLIEIINPESFYDIVMNDKGEVLNTKFHVLHDNERFQFCKDKLYLDMLTQYVIPMEIIEKKRMSKFLKYTFKKVLMYTYCRNINSYYHEFLINNYKRLLADFNDDWYYEFHQRIKQGLIETI